ncbi:MAG: hypothetical protein JKY96_04590 [Phycisphaerales bacterium]|nr:hypothetical protein [Phycisphaerales bacterium]
MSKAKTPFEELGYTKDQKFVLIDDAHEHFEEGDVVKLATDDGTAAPYFTGIDPYATYAVALSRLEIYTDDEETPVSKKGHVYEVTGSTPFERGTLVVVVDGDDDDGWPFLKITSIIPCDSQPVGTSRWVALSCLKQLWPLKSTPKFTDAKCAKDCLQVLSDFIDNCSTRT